MIKYRLGALVLNTSGEMHCEFVTDRQRSDRVPTGGKGNLAPVILG